MRRYLFLFSFIISVSGYSQVIPAISQAPQTATLSRYDNFGTPPADQSGQVQVGSTVNNIPRQQSHPTQLQNTLTEQQRREQMIDAFAELDNRTTKQSLVDIELDTIFGKPPITSKEKYEITRSFWDALVVLTEMGDGKRKFSITEAIYTVENAYFHNRLSQGKFYEAIQTRADLCRQIMQREKLSPDNNLAKNYAIQKLYQQTNNYNNPKTGKTIKIPKMEYDFTDFMGDSSRAQMFVSKLIATGKGQCHSMPLLYLAIAEQLGAEANLSLAPQHSFIRFADGDGSMYNFESTQGYIVSDKWMLQSGYISTAAIKNKIYLDTLSQKQLLALCIYDLAIDYIHDYGYDGFTETALKYGMQHDPKGIQGNLVLANFWAAKTRNATQYYNLKTKNEFDKNIVAVTLQKRMLQTYDVIDGLGYQEMPKAAYQAWLQSVNEQKEKQDQKQLQQQMQYLLQNSKVKITAPTKKD